MISKIYDKFKKFIKINYKELIFLVLFAIFMIFPLPYYICVSGGTISVGDRIKIEDSYDEEGSFNLAYVTQLKATPATYLLSYVIPSWEKISVESYMISEDETEEDVENRDHLYLSDANQSAVVVAYTKAGKKVEINEHHYLVYFVDPKVTGDVKVGDELIGVDDLKEINLESFRAYIQTKNIGDIVKLKINRNGKEMYVNTEVFEEENTKYVGLAFFDIINYQTNPKIEINFEKDESGPSGGLTLALAIYNKLTIEDITNGRKIVGTGTIDLLGNVGTIGGVKYKLMGAVKAKADVFIVPNGENYEECIKLKEEKGYDIEIIGVSTFDEALAKLEDL